MPKKSRTPPPPRPVQAPKRRYEPTTRGFSRRTKEIAGGVAVVAAVGIAIGVVLGGRGGSGDVAKKLAAGGCTFATYADLGARHVDNLTAKIDYNSLPPTSGPHYFQPALWGFYDDPLDSQVRAVHNLEHGGVVVQWGRRVPRATVEQLRAFWNESPNGMLMAPLPRLGKKIALTAWTHLATCTRFEEDAVKAFRDAYRGKGPERIPVSRLTPGS